MPIELSAAQQAPTGQSPFSAAKNKNLLKALLSLGADVPETKYAGGYAIPNRGAGFARDLQNILGGFTADRFESLAQEERQARLDKLLSDPNITPQKLITEPETRELGLEQLKDQLATRRLTDALGKIDPRFATPQQPTAAAAAPQAAIAQPLQQPAQQVGGAPPADATGVTASPQANPLADIEGRRADALRRQYQFAALGFPQLAAVARSEYDALASNPITQIDPAKLIASGNGFSLAPGALQAIADLKAAETGATKQASLAYDPLIAGETERATRQAAAPYTTSTINLPGQGPTLVTDEQKRQLAAGGGVPSPGGGNVTGTLNYLQQALTLLPSLVRAESRGRTDAVSPKGARGPAQITEPTARELSRKLNIPTERILQDPHINMFAGAYYLAEQLDRYGGDAERAVRAYNAGPGAEDAGLAATFPETQKYQGRVLGGQQPLQQPRVGQILVDPEAEASKRRQGEAASSAALKQVEESYKSVSRAAPELQAINVARETVPRAFTGQLSDQKQFVQKTLRTLFPEIPADALEDTETLGSTLANINNKYNAVAGRGDLNAREYEDLRRSGGTIYNQPDVLLRLLNNRERALRYSLSQHSQLLTNVRDQYPGLGELRSFEQELPAPSPSPQLPGAQPVFEGQNITGPQQARKPKPKLLNRGAGGFTVTHE